jgi:dimethylamine/trimethylamine dehydrogenase
VLVWDDDHYYLAGVLAELLAEAGFETVYATPASEASTWTRATMEQAFIQTRLLEKGIEIRPHRALEAVAPGAATLACVFTGRSEELAVDAVVPVTARLPNEALARDLAARRDDWAAAGIVSVTAIGDALAPATIAHAVYAGRRYAEELDAPPPAPGAVPFKREIAELLPS